MKSKRRLQFSILSLLGLALVVAVIFAFVIANQTLQQNQLVVKVGNELQKYDIASASFGIHKEGKTFFLTVLCSASNEQPLDPPKCRLEFSIPFDKDPSTLLVDGARFAIPVYDETHGNLNFFYFLGFGDIEKGHLTIIRTNKSGFWGKIEANGGSLLVNGQFEKQKGISRSFD